MGWGGGFKFCCLFHILGGGGGKNFFVVIRNIKIGSILCEQKVSYDGNCHGLLSILH